MDSLSYYYHGLYSLLHIGGTGRKRIIWIRTREDESGFRNGPTGHELTLIILLFNYFTN